MGPTKGFIAFAALCVLTAFVGAGLPYEPGRTWALVVLAFLFMVAAIGWQKQAERKSRSRHER
jgi:peptidoglycan/LPS O-acetylase OafA/YrhL